MLTGVGITVVWRLGRSGAGNPEAFANIWWQVIIAAAIILLIGRLSRAFFVGDIAAVLAALFMTLASWWLVQRWGFNNLYELVPAFIGAAGATLAVSAVLKPEE